MTAVNIIGNFSGYFVSWLKLFILRFHNYLISNSFCFLPSRNLTLLLLQKHLWVAIKTITACCTSDFLIFAVINELTVILLNFCSTSSSQTHRQRTFILIIWGLIIVWYWLRLLHFFHSFLIVKSDAFRCILSSRIL